MTREGGKSRNVAFNSPYGVFSRDRECNNRLSIVSSVYHIWDEASLSHFGSDLNKKSWRNYVRKLCGCQTQFHNILKCTFIAYMKWQELLALFSFAVASWLLTCHSPASYMRRHPIDAWQHSPIKVIVQSHSGLTKLSAIQILFTITS